jgi:hypothetical protein
VNILYTFVIDRNTRFIDQGRIFLRTLLAAGVPTDQIIVQVTEESGAKGHALAASFGVRSVRLPLGPDGKFCNKIGQLFNVSDDDFDVLAVCDTDLAFLKPLDAVASLHNVRGKRVDFENPPLAILDELHAFLRIDAHPEIVSPTCAPDGATYSYNCNGGVLLIPRQFVSRIGETWRDYANILVDAAQKMQRWTNHIDQVAWAFAMMALRLPFEELTPEWNFPTPVARQVPVGTYGAPCVLHHHHDLDTEGLIQKTSISLVDDAITKVNAILS